jgi:hypothetical protein
MFSINVYKTREDCATVSPLPVKRDWMDATYDAHAYKCFPVTLTNTLGWALSFPEDITFIWDGITDTTPGHVKVLQGEKYVYTERANATISFKTGLIFQTDPNVSILQMSPPNYMLDGVEPFTILMSTSFYKSELPSAWRITKPNVEITIKANTPFISFIPVSLTDLNNSEIMLGDQKDIPKDFYKAYDPGYTKAISDLNQSGEWSNFYRNAIDSQGNKLGEHEVKSLRFKVTERGKSE